eukprot:2184088-Prymnesium_polylepis.1
MPRETAPRSCAVRSRAVRTCFSVSESCVRFEPSAPESDERPDRESGCAGDEVASRAVSGEEAGAGPGRGCLGGAGSLRSRERRVGGSTLTPGDAQGASSKRGWHPRGSLLCPQCNRASPWAAQGAVGRRGS